MLDSTLDNFITKFKFSLHIPSFIINIRTTPGFLKNHSHGLINYIYIFVVNSDERIVSRDFKRQILMQEAI